MQNQNHLRRLAARGRWHQYLPWDVFFEPRTLWFMIFRLKVAACTWTL